MFDSIRKRQRLMMLILLLLILPAFVFWGISGYDGMLSRERSVGSVDGQPISRQEFDEAQRQQVERLRQMLGDAIDARLFDTPEARRELLEGLIAQRVVARQSQERRVAVTDAQLREAILAIPGLKREDGSFDDLRYRALLSQQNMSPAGFEARLRVDLTLQALPESVQLSAMVPAAVLERFAALLEERREVREYRFDPALFAAGVNPTDEQLEAFYETNARSFETPETARIEYVVLDREAVAATLSVSAGDLKAHYEQNRSRYGTAEERRASHILIQASPDAKVRAQALLDRIQADPTQFEAIARASSDDPGSAAQGGDLGFFGRTMMVKPFADAVFAMQEDEIVGPVESEFGQHIIRLTAIRPAAEKPFEEVRAQIEREVRLAQAGQKYAEAAEAFTNTVYEQSDSLQAAAEKFGLQIQVADSVTRQPSPDAPPGTPLASARLLAAVFSDEAVRNRRNTEALEVSSGRLVSARVVEHRPAQRKPLDEVRDTVRQRVVETEAARLAKEAGEARLAKLKAGQGDLTGFSAARTATRGDAGGFAPPALEAIFRLPIDPLPAFGGVDLGLQGYAILQMISIAPATAEQIAQRRKALEPQVLRAVAQQEVVDYIESLKARTAVVRNLDRLGRPADQQP